MNSSPVIAACKNLFNVQPYLAHGIIPTLRIEDIKIALAKKLHETRRTKRPAASALRADEHLNSYNLLIEYITNHNLDVMLALESHSDNSSDGSLYLYPNSTPKKSSLQPNETILTKKNLYFSGTLPPRKVRFGTFLYYKGIISYYHLMESIAWQKDRRPLLGQMAMQIGKLTADEFARIIVHVKNGECFGSVARRYKMLSENVITTLVKAQQKYDCRIGRYFTEKNICTAAEINQLDKEMQIHNHRFH